MQVPVCTIVLKSTNNSCAVKLLPRYFADMFRAVWGQRLDKDGLEIHEIDDLVAENTRYREVDSIEQEERAVVRFFSGDSVEEEAKMAALFRQVFPNGLREIIAKLIIEDQRNIEIRAKRRAAAQTAHPSFLEAEVGQDLALRLQGAGWSTLSEVPADVVTLAEAGVPAIEIQALIEKIEAAKAAKVSVAATSGKNKSPFGG